MMTSHYQPRMASIAVAFLALLGLALAGCAGGRRGAAMGTAMGASTVGGDDVGWEQIGERRIGFAADHDTIPVTWLKGDFKRIRIKVEGDNPVHMMDLKIVYATGGVQDVPLRREFAPNTWSRIIDLRGGDRVIRRIEITYRTEGRLRNGAAHVRVFAKN
ncbi:MAG: hypothetical protein AB7K09_02925 [Planctomycetota bacterium]